jgi:hypothetical protein
MYAVACVNYAIRNDTSQRVGGVEEDVRKVPRPYRRARLCLCAQVIRLRPHPASKAGKRGGSSGHKHHGV